MAMTGREILEDKVANRLQKNPEQAQDIGVKVAVVLTGDEGGRWVLDCTTNPATVNKDDASEVGTTITMSGENLVKMSAGELNGITAFMFGKIKVQGDVAVAIKLGKILT